MPIKPKNSILGKKNQQRIAHANGSCSEAPATKN
jgi:hypothetical protein